MDELSKALDGMTKVLLGMQLTSMMEGCVTAQRMCQQLEKDGMYDKLEDIYRKLSKMNVKLLEELEAEDRSSVRVKTAN